MARKDSYRRTSRGPQAVSPPHRTRHGVTLIELLVVISILMLLAAVTIPTMRPAMQNRRIREAARLVNGYLSAARVKAMSTGRAYGVELTRSEEQPEGAVILRQIQLPAPYIGGSADARVRVQQWHQDWPVFKVLTRYPDYGDFQNYTIREGDLMQFEVPGWRRGALTYMILDATNYYTPAAGDVQDFPPHPRNGAYINFNPPGQDFEKDSTGVRWLTTHVLTVVLIDRAVRTPWPIATTSKYDPTNTSNWSNPVPFCIMRQPIPAEGEPLRLPEQTCIDLCESGSAYATFEPINAYMPVWILFSPTGTIDSVYGVFHAATGASTVSRADRLFLMVGRRDRLPISPVYPSVSNGAATTADRGSPQNEDGLYNWQDANNLWVTVNPANGLATTVENAVWTPPSGFDYNARDSQNQPTDRLTALTQARRLAARAESMGGR